MDIISKMQDTCLLKTTACCRTIFTSLSFAIIQLLKKIYFEFFLHLKKEVSSCWQNIVRFRHNIAYMVNSYVASLDILVMINMLYEMIENLHRKILNARYWTL